MSCGQSWDFDNHWLLTGSYFECLFLSFLSSGWFRLVLNGKYSQKYPINAGIPQSSLGPKIFLQYINNLSDDVICNISVYADYTTLYSKYDQVSYLWKQLEFAAEPESDLRHTRSGIGFLILRLEKLNFFHLSDLKTVASLMLKQMSLFMRKNNTLRCWSCLSLLN